MWVARNILVGSSAPVRSRCRLRSRHDASAASSAAPTLTPRPADSAKIKWTRCQGKCPQAGSLAADNLRRSTAGNNGACPQQIPPARTSPRSLGGKLVRGTPGQEGALVRGGSPARPGARQPARLRSCSSSAPRPAGRSGECHRTSSTFGSPAIRGAREHASYTRIVPSRRCPGAGEF